MRVSELLALVQATVRRKRNENRDRFRGRYDGWRLFALGVILVNIAIIAFANAFFYTLAFQYRPGTASLFGGIMLAILIIRLGRPKVFLDWTLIGTLHVWLGLIVTNDPMLISSWSLALFWMLLTVSSALKVWIGKTLVHRSEGSAWPLACGFASLLSAVVWGIINWVTLTIEPDVMLATDLLLLGLSICGLGLYLRREMKQ